MAVLRVTEVLNPYDGRHVDLVLDRAPTGSLTVYANRTPETPGEEALAIDLGGKRYRVTSPFPAPDESAPELTYFTVEDSAGLSVWRDEDGYLQGQAAAWIGNTREDELTDVMKQLRWRLQDNAVGIEARLRAIEPEITLKQIIWGMEEALETYPSMEIDQVALSEPYEGTNRFRIASVKADIFGYIVHQAPTVEAELITAFGRAVQRILNQEAYEQMTLLGGQLLVSCQAQDLGFDNNIWNGTRFVSSFNLSWSGQYGESIP